MFSRLIRYFRLMHQKKLLKESRFFDADWYVNTYQDVKNSNIDPLVHFLLYGYKEGRNPSVKFDTSWYLENYKDVDLSRINPLFHYIRHGVKEGRLPRPGPEHTKYLQADNKIKSLETKTNSLKQELEKLKEMCALYQKELMKVESQLVTTVTESNKTREEKSRLIRKYEEIETKWKKDKEIKKEMQKDLQRIKQMID